PPISNPGHVFGEFRIDEFLNRGGMGEVYKAFHLKLQQPVALKVLPAERMSDPAAVARFQREMAAVGRLDHPHIVRASHAGERDGIHYLVMDFVDGIDLARLIEQTGPLPAAAACHLVQQSAIALQYAHEQGLVHRDIKPSNLMLSAEGRMKVLDFGLARLRPDRIEPGDLTRPGDWMGTADYMAPEQWLDARSVDIRADIYSLGCTLYY